MNVTIRDVARAAGVSATTVSRVFNQEHLVSPETRLRILDVAERLRYVPNAAARSLSIRQTSVLGLLVPLPHSEFFTEMVRGMDEVAQEHGYILLISGSHNRIEDARTAFRSMKGQTDGLLIASPNVEAAALQEALPVGVPAVFLHSPVLEGEAYGSLRVTNRKGAYAATRHLLELGHERIGIVTGPATHEEAQERLAGFQEALRDAGLSPDPLLQIEGDFSRESGVAAGAELIARAPRPTAIFACNDLMAIGVLSVLHAAALRVPEDVALIGFDDIPMAQYVQPPLSTVHVPTLEMGRRAVTRLVDLIANRGQHGGTQDLFETALIPRASTLGFASAPEAPSRTAFTLSAD